jgi:hypothetical protein
LQIEIFVLALALIISPEEGNCTEEDVNSHTKREDTTLEHVINNKNELSLEKEYDLKQKQQEINELAENKENVFQHLEKISEFEGHQDNEQYAKQETRNQGQQIQDEANRKVQHVGKEKHLNVDMKQPQGEVEALKPQQDEENRKTQHTGKEKHLNVDMKETKGEAKTSKLQHDAKEKNKDENDGEFSEEKHKNKDKATLEEAHKSNSQEEHSDQQTAQNNGLEIRQHDQHLEHPLEGYQVTETGQDEGHQLASQNDFNYLFSYHGGHNVQHSSSIFEGTSLHKHHDVPTLTLTDERSFQRHFPVYIPDEKHVPHAAQKTVSSPPKHFVSHPAALPYAIHKPVPYPVKVPVERPYFVPVPVEKKVPFAVHVRVPVPQPYTVHVPKPYTVVVEKKVPAPYPVRVEVPVPQLYPVKVNVPVPVPVDRPVPVPVKVSVDRPVPVPVEEPYPVTLQKEIHSPVEKFPHAVQVRSTSSNLRPTIQEERELKVFEEC